MLLRIQRDTVRRYAVTETTLTLDAVLRFYDLPGDLRQALEQEARARLGEGELWPRGGFRYECQIRVDFDDVCSVIAIHSSSGRLQVDPLFMPNEDSVATAAEWARASEAWRKQPKRSFSPVRDSRS